ncbi:hypothetical protein [Portibacter marinus]|uniref:hypothetical protein n=1 Tax=Portibacter marinus TaxID=2898660 RepID=UPI00387330D0
MMYASKSDQIFTSFYAGSSVVIPLEEGNVYIEQKTAYPFDGLIDLMIKSEDELSFALNLRIPTWAGNQLVPGELYQYLNSREVKPEISVNGKAVSFEVENGFAVIKRKWATGDKVTLNLNMHSRFNKAIDFIEANRGRLAVSRGPLVYCAEGVDHDFQLSDVMLKSEAEEISVESIGSGILKGIPSIKVKGTYRVDETDKEVGLQMIPYYSWNNRGNSPMFVWIKEK